MSPMLEEKKKLVAALAKKMSSSKTILIASTKNLPSSQYQAIKKNLRGKAEIKIAKKSIVIRAISATEKGTLQNLKEHIGADIAIFFSNLDAFELSGLLADNQNPAKAKPGDIPLDDITIEAGPTDLPPGPAISELSGVGLKVSVEAGKLAIRQGATVAKKGEPIKENVASVLGKLNILPMKVGFTPLLAYDSVSDKIYVGIKIDKIAALEELREAIKKSFGFAISTGYVSSDTIKWLIAKAGLEEKALERVIDEKERKGREKNGEEINEEKNK